MGYNNVWTMGGRGSARICERSSESSSSLSTNPTIALQEGVSLEERREGRGGKGWEGEGKGGEEMGMVERDEDGDEDGRDETGDRNDENDERERGKGERMWWNLGG